MALTSRTDVVAALSSGRPQDLIGTTEAEWIDFKTAPYDLKEPRGKAELAKDVAAFANRAGGLIVCGIKAAQRSGELYETAAQLTPFDPGRISADTYLKALASEARPLLTVHLALFPHPDTGDGTTGSYLVIDVEQLPEDQRYALVRRTIVDGKVKDGWCVPIRTGDQTDFMSADDVYSLINGGVRSRMYPAAPTAAAVLPPLDRAGARQALVEHQGWDGAPVLFWQSSPDVPPSFLPTLHSDGGIRGALEKQKVLRHMGFNFSFEHNRAVPFAGGLLLSEPRRALAVAADGTVTAAAIANPDMLCWAMAQNYGDAHRINVFALTELTYEYFRLVDQHVVPAISGRWRHRVAATGFEGLRLAPGANPVFPRTGSPREATAAEFNLDWLAGGSPEADAYQALARIYSGFGLSGDDNPYVQDKLLAPELLEAASR
ncbi:helix-turn-helix domain-containing protein [Kitasatospora sp. NPDC058965]|uniref:AlbA family DNA-binding domain-containing protein n=1 Tax=Kitasatospora sp. NPDC058965 TaxID=3346682 RepID=UPI00368FD067